VGYHVVQLPRQPGPFHILRVPGSDHGRIAVRTGDLTHAQRYGQDRAGNGRIVAAVVSRQRDEDREQRACRQCPADPAHSAAAVGSEAVGGGENRGAS